MKHPNVTRLYKYRAFDERALNILRDQEVWMAGPESFNDPFDCALSPPSERTTKDLLEQLFALNEELYGKEKAQRINKDIKERNKNKEVKVIGNSSLEKHLSEAMKMGVFSLSEKPDNILMWSHYGDHHKGFCIEFERSNHPHNFLNHVMCRPVNYSSKYPNLNRMLNHFDINLFTKAKDWEYEAEWRLVSKQANVLLPAPAPIVGIIFGMKMREEHKKEIMGLLKDTRHVVFKQATPKKGEFSRGRSEFCVSLSG